MTKAHLIKCNLRSAIIGGIAGTLLFDLVGLLITGNFWDIPALLAEKLVGEPDLRVGVPAHYTNGIILAFLYGALRPYLPGGRWARPAVYMVGQTIFGVWLFMMPLLGAGAFGLGLGAAFPVISLTRHLVFALALGAAYSDERCAVPSSSTSNLVEANA